MTSDDLNRLLSKKGYAVVAESKPGTKPVLPVPIAALVPIVQGKRIRQHAGDGLNNWERSYWQTELDGRWTYIYREVAFPLANGLKYKLDWLVVRKADGALTIEGHEVKGRALAAGIAKVKMAARLYPWIAFKLVTKRRKKQGGGWAIEEVLP